MERIVKKIVIVFGVLLTAFLLYVAYSYWNLKVQSAAADRASAELEVGYQAQLKQYQSALRIGTSRTDVREYLDNRKVVYNDWRGEITVRLGQEPSVFPCNYWTVHVSFEFGHAKPQDEPMPSDPLDAISLKRIGHCL